MKKYYTKAIITFLFIFNLVVACCSYKVENKSENQDYSIEDNGKGLIERGFYNNNNRRYGTWYILQDNKLIEKIIYITNDSSIHTVIEHIIDDKLCFSEERIDSQLLRLKVSDTLRFEEIYYRLDAINMGGDIFSFKCGSCHQAKPFVCEEIDCDKYSTNKNLFLLLCSEKHKINESTIDSKLNVYEAKLVADYLNPIVKKSK
jgi:hypothetical protein